MAEKLKDESYENVDEYEEPQVQIARVNSSSDLLVIGNSNTVHFHQSGNYKYDDRYVKVLENYEGTRDNELSIKKGEVLPVKDVNEHWWLVETDNRFGHIPKNYVTEIEKGAAVGACTDEVYEDVGEVFKNEHAYDYPENVPKRRIRIVMVGKTGSGKSSTANSIMKSEYFVARPSGQSVTRECSRGEADGYKCTYSVVDTPGLFDTLLSPQEIRQNIIKCIHDSYPGPHLFLIVIQIGRFTTEEIEALDNLFEIFGNSMENHSILVFTRYDDLQRHKISIETYIEESGESLQKYIRKCKGRYFAINNIEPEPGKSELMERFYNSIHQVVENNTWTPYSHEMYEEAQKSVQPKIDRSKEERVKRNKEEIESIEISYKMQQLELDKHKDEISNKIKTSKELLQSELTSMEDVQERLVMKPEDKEKDTGKIFKRHRSRIGGVHENLEELYQGLNELEEKEAKLEIQRKELEERRIRHIIETTRNQKNDLYEDLRKVTDEHFAKMDKDLQTVTSLESRIISLEKQTEGAKKSEKKRISAEISELVKQREEIYRNNEQYLQKIVEKSDFLRRQMSKKEKRGFCKIM